MTQENKDLLLNLYADEFFKNMCIQRAVKKDMKDEFLENTQEVQDEICKSLQKTYGVDYIVGVNFSTLTVQ